MTIAGFIRELDAASRRSAREEQRSLRQMAAFRLQAAKEHARELAKQAVDEYENYIRMLETIHHECSPDRDWSQLAKQSLPAEPKLQIIRQERAKNAALSYRPSFWDRVLFRAESKQNKLDDAFRRAQRSDKEDNERRHAQWRTDCLEIQQLRNLAQRVCDKEESAFGEVINEMLPLQSLAIATNAKLRWDSLSLIEVDIRIKDSDVIPDYILSLTKTGKLSEKSMPKKLYWEMYQDVVCAAAIRAAREVMALLPFEEALIHCEAVRPSTSTGLDENGILLSVRFPRESFNQLIFSRIDPSDSISSFEHRMQFKRGEGFRFVEPIKKGF